jgi:hypothetical protein
MRRRGNRWRKRVGGERGRGKGDKEEAQKGKKGKKIGEGDWKEGEKGIREKERIGE